MMELTSEFLNWVRIPACMIEDHFFAATLSTMKGLTHGKMGLESVTTVIHSFMNGEREDTAGKR